MRKQKNTLREGLVDMRDSYQKKLKQLSDQVIDMGMLCEQAVMKTFQLLQSTENKKELIAEIEKYEKDIDEKEGEIEAITMQLLLRQQPMAADLRMISASICAIPVYAQQSRAAPWSSMTFLGTSSISSKNWCSSLEHTSLKIWNPPKIATANPKMLQTMVFLFFLESSIFPILYILNYIIISPLLPIL